MTDPNPGAVTQKKKKADDGYRSARQGSEIELDAGGVSTPEAPRNVQGSGALEAKEAVSARPVADGANAAASETDRAEDHTQSADAGDPGVELSVRREARVPGNFVGSEQYFVRAIDGETYQQAGDVVVLDFKLTNKSEEVDNLSLVSQSPTTGLKFVSYESSPDGCVLKLEPTAPAIGTVGISVDLTAEVDGQTTELPVNTAITVAMSMKEFQAKLMQAKSKIADAYDTLSKYLESWGAKFQVAFDSYERVIDADKQVLSSEVTWQEVLVDTLLTGATTFLSGGAGGAIKKAVKAAKHGTFVTGGTIALGKWGMKLVNKRIGDALEAGAQGDRGGGTQISPPAPIEFNPSSISSDIHLRVLAEKEGVTDFIDDLIAGLYDTTRTIDPTAGIEQHLTFDGRPMAALETFDDNAAASMELGLLCEWLKRNAVVVADVYLINNEEPKAVAKRGYAAEGPLIERFFELCGQTGHDAMSLWIDCVGRARAAATKEVTSRNQDWQPNNSAENDAMPVRR